MRGDVPLRSDCRAKAAGLSPSSRLQVFQLRLDTKLTQHGLLPLSELQGTYGSLLEILS